MQVDEAWSFCYAKAKNLPEEKRALLGTEMFGLGLRLMRTQSLYPAGVWADAMHGLPLNLLTTWRAVWRTESS